MNRITRLHRILFWLSIVPGGLFALGYYLAPVGFNEMVGAEAPDPAAIRSLGGLLIASSVGALLALRSGKWQEVRIFTVYMMLFNLLNGAGLGLHLLRSGDMALLPNVILLLILGLGFAYVVWQRREEAAPVAAGAGQGR